MTQDGPPTLTLRSPIKQGPQTYAVLTFREPKGADLCASGYPFKFAKSADGDTVRLLDAPAITQLISRMAEVPLSVAKAMDVRDWNDAVAIISDFFVDAEEPTTK